ncbi:hypothetical protein M8C21_003177 [Ambrosia artemisiifolia]|uniref:Uncharacterized protein n=1 Tax=Ambrosia artemisiifolia TaxID=4212 RepID=A0AAD5DFC3_AMBAR|nr:hypothetical protein M8C21_003177 [Ambrosia artemisiifolia]
MERLFEDVDKLSAENRSVVNTFESELAQDVGSLCNMDFSMQPPTQELMGSQSGTYLPRVGACLLARKGLKLIPTISTFAALSPPSKAREDKLSAGNRSVGFKARSDGGWSCISGSDQISMCFWLRGSEASLERGKIRMRLKACGLLWLVFRAATLRYQRLPMRTSVKSVVKQEKKGSAHPPKTAVFAKIGDNT